MRSDTSTVHTRKGSICACSKGCCQLSPALLLLLLSSQLQSSGGQHTARRVQRGLRVLLLRALGKGLPSRLRPVLGWGPTASLHRQRPGLPGEQTHPTVHLLPHLQPTPELSDTGGQSTMHVPSSAWNAVQQVHMTVMQARCLCFRFLLTESTSSYPLPQRPCRRIKHAGH